MAAVSLFWDSNMAAVTSCENTLLPILIQTENSVVSHYFIFIPIADAICHTPRVEEILESYAKAYFNQFKTGNSPFQLVQCSIVPNNKRTANM